MLPNGRQLTLTVVANPRKVALNSKDSKKDSKSVNNEATKPKEDEGKSLLEKLLSACEELQKDEPNSP